MKGLTAGRMVHYVLIGNEMIARMGNPVMGSHRPAVVVELAPEAGRVELQVFLSRSDGFTATSMNVIAVYAETNEPGTWHWIEPA